MTQEERRLQRVRKAEVRKRNRLFLRSDVLALLALCFLASQPVYAAGNPTIEKGKALFESGQYMAALGEFMTVLRSEPSDPEARRYLRLVVDAMRQSALGATGNLKASNQAPVMDQAVTAQVRALLQKRALLSLDLKSLPGIAVDITENLAQIRMDSALLFAPGSGGLKEGGIPVLDRVSAWLKTFGEQPVIVHIYPDELQEAGTNGNLFLRRYSELYGFLVEERKIEPKRFVSANLLKGETAPVVAVSTRAEVVIETFGAQTALLDGMPAALPKHVLNRFLEFSIEASKTVFNPVEGEWANLDVAAVTRSGLRQWSFQIVPAKAGQKWQALSLKGNENVLRRISWDGREEKTGRFVPAGTYRCRLQATDSDGKIKTAELAIRVVHSGNVAVYQPKGPAALAAKVKPKTQAKTKPAATQPEPDPAVETAASETVPESDSQAIWKQVIQFDSGDAVIQPSLKASLERIAKTLEVYPLQKVRIMGFAENNEPDALTLAKKRADAIRQALVGEYKVKPERVLSAGGQVTAEPGGSKVELSITN